MPPEEDKTANSYIKEISHSVKYNNPLYTTLETDGEDKLQNTRMRCSGLELLEPTPLSPLLVLTETGK